ncbi:hypothetical protein ACFWDF_29840 [Streptomyces diastaticus]|uniref:hypothetical protein n=1 Tax=Streptomyces diastaticus TaxID=1956 RepID=UPI0035D775D0
MRTYGQAAEMFGVSERSVGTWWRASRAGGRAGGRCCSRQVREPRAGKGELIDESARGAVLQAMRDYTRPISGRAG